MKRIEMNPFLAIKILQGRTDATEKEKIQAYQHLIDTKLIWHLDEEYQRTAKELLTSGICKPHRHTLVYIYDTNK